MTQISDGKPICYEGLHEFWNIAGRPQVVLNFTFKFYLYLPKET